MYLLVGLMFGLIFGWLLRDWFFGRRDNTDERSQEQYNHPRQSLTAHKDSGAATGIELQALKDQIANLSAANDTYQTEREALQAHLVEQEKTITELEDQLAHAESTAVAAEQVAETISTATEPASASEKSTDAAEPTEVNIDALKASLPTATGAPDDLKKIKGIGKVIAKLLNDLGVTTFAQIAQFNDEQLHQVAQVLKVFPDRAVRDDWIGQAKKRQQEKSGH